VTAQFNKRLVEQLQNSERVACRRLVDAYQDRLVNEAVEVFHVDRADAEELVSDVLLAVVEKIHSFAFQRGDGDFHAWVVTLFRNKMRDHIRRSALRQGLTERYDESSLTNEVEFSQTERRIAQSIVRQYEDAIKQAEDEGGSAPASKLLAIVDALEQLESWERVLLRCRALDIPYDDIAGYTGKPVSQLKVYHPRVKKKLVKILATYYPELQGNETRSA
jgi:RNA polymerase sigma factor (sigma-70 family)